MVAHQMHLAENSWFYLGIASIIVSVVFRYVSHHWHEFKRLRLQLLREKNLTMSQTSSTDTTVTGGATTTKTTSLTASPATMLRELLHDMVDFTHTRSLQLETSIRGKIDTVVSMMEAGAANVKDDVTLKTSTTSAAPVSNTTSAGPRAFSVNNGGTVLSSGTTASGASGNVEHVSSGGSSSATVETGSGASKTMETGTSVSGGGGTSEVKETTSSGSTTS
jgi:hypothetical protein